MLVVTHLHHELGLIHVSTHKEGGKTNNRPTSAYVSKARWAQDNHRTNDSAQHNYDDGFQCTLIATGLCADDWTDEVHTVDDNRYKAHRQDVLNKWIGEGYTNVGSTRNKPIRSMLTGLVGNNGWGKPYNKTQAKMRQDFEKLSLILVKQGYKIADDLFNRVYLCNVRENGYDGVVLQTKGQIFDYILKDVGFAD
jgi:hypothetical protein